MDTQPDHLVIPPQVLYELMCGKYGRDNVRPFYNGFLVWENKKWRFTDDPADGIADDIGIQ